MDEPILQFHAFDDPLTGRDAPGPMPKAARHEVSVGDVYVCRDDPGFGIFNYRGEPVLDSPVGSSAEAARLAHEIVLPWQGHVVVDDPSDG